MTCKLSCTGLRKGALSFRNKRSSFIPVITPRLDGSSETLDRAITPRTIQWLGAKRFSGQEMNAGDPKGSAAGWRQERVVDDSEAALAINFATRRRGFCLQQSSGIVASNCGCLRAVRAVGARAVLGAPGTRSRSAWKKGLPGIRGRSRTVPPGKPGLHEEMFMRGKSIAGLKSIWAGSLLACGFFLVFSACAGVASARTFAPEMDPGSAGSMITLLAGGALILAQRLRR